MITRRRFIQLAGVSAAALALYEHDPSEAVATPGWTDDDYWAFADRLQLILDSDWNDRLRAYAPPGGGASTQHNANLLYTHAAAAAAGHTGAARRDERARILAERLCETPPWVADLPGAGGCPSAQPPERRGGGQAPDGTQKHACGWGSGINTTTRQHVVIDTEVVRGLAMAYAARAALALPDHTVALIRDRIQKTANSTFYAYPSLRLNQINWPIEIYAHAVAVLGKRHLLRHDCHLQLSRFVAALTRPAPGMRIANTGPGYRFHYLPQAPASRPSNLDSAEYASIVCGALLFYGQARASGMADLRPRELARLRAWVERVLCGYWTHGGYLNWDTGLGFRRWHQVKKPPLCMQALLAIALSPRFQPRPAYGHWAKYFFDRGLELYDRLLAEYGAPPPGVLFGVTRTPSAKTDPQFAAARMQANAARACMLGLSRVPAQRPPALYAYDPDVGRLAITTPAYNTAIVTVNQGAFPYGGVELARLFDADQRIAANLGGRPPASFGVVVRARATGHETTSQHGRLRPNLAHPPLRLAEAPRGAVARPAAYPPRAYAGPFTRLEAVGVTAGPGVQIRTRHRFAPEYVQTWWRVVPQSARGDHDVRVLFPSTGADATATAVLRDGTRVPVGAVQPRLADIAWVHIAGQECGYVIVPRSRRPLPGRARMIQTRPQSTAPHAGPTLAFELLRDAPLRELFACVRIAPARTAQDAQAVARALGA